MRKLAPVRIGMVAEAVSAHSAPLQRECCIPIWGVWVRRDSGLLQVTLPGTWLQVTLES